MAGLSKLHSTSTQEHFEEKSYHVFLGARTVFSPNSGKKLGASLSELHFMWTDSHSKKTNGFRKASSFSFVFGFLVESFWAVGKKTSVCLSKLHSTLSQEEIWRQTFQQFPVFFRIFAGNFSKFYLLNWGKSVETVSVLMNLLGKKFWINFFFCFWMMR